MKDEKSTQRDLPSAKIKNDIIFIIALLAAVSLIGLAFFIFRDEGDKVTVTVDGAIYGEYSLGTNVRVDIRTGDDMSESNVLIIKDGKAYVESATCPDGICASHKPISREGESIVCLPHKVVITVDTVEESEAPDIVA